MSAPGAGSLRIIGGRWRGRKVSFPGQDELRPTPNRVRETLFNWLDPSIADARCLDLFAGSGALTIEALSRGAAHVAAIDISSHVIRHLSDQLNRLAEPGRPLDVKLIQEDAMLWLKSAARRAGAPFDIVFIDPPFSTDLAPRCCHLLAEGGLLSPDALIYIESARGISPEDLPPGWDIHRQKRASQVHYCLCSTS